VLATAEARREVGTIEDETRLSEPCCGSLICAVRIV
jgi:hypothetical protein